MKSYKPIVRYILFSLIISLCNVHASQAQVVPVNNEISDVDFPAFRIDSAELVKYYSRRHNFFNRTNTFWKLVFQFQMVEGKNPGDHKIMMLICYALNKPENVMDTVSKQVKIYIDTTIPPIKATNPVNLGNLELIRKELIRIIGKRNVVEQFKCLTIQPNQNKGSNHITYKVSTVDDADKAAAGSTAELNPCPPGHPS